ncbi:MAG: Do family serine endopeptidase [Chitinophagales bacterium]|nr:Do family serine endopeptidase [Chitinophagales bacterium]
MNIKKLGLTAFVAIVSALVAVSAYKYLDNKYNPVSFEQRQASSHFAQVNYDPMPSAGLTDFRYAAKITTPGVVHIKTSYAPRQASRNDQANPFRDFFGDDFNPFGQPFQQQPSESSGSGVIISDDGYIVTNNHVIDKGDKIQVILADKKTYEAKVIGTDASTDLALIKIDEDNLPFISFGNSDSISVGEWVLAVGNPFNLESTVTAGIVSAKGRNINIIGRESRDRGQSNDAIEAYIQTDAAVNPGNSGGALVDTRGALIGINSAIATPTGTFAGYSFAVPVNIVKKVVNDLMKFGVVQRGFLGVSIATVTDDLAKAKHLDNLNGVYIDSVNSGSAASAAGLKHGDVITKINNSMVNTSPELQEQVSRYHPGDKISVTYLREGKEKTADVVLKNREGNTEYIKKEEVSSQATLEALGAEFTELNDKEKKDLGLNGGVKVIKLNDGILSRNTSIREGFIITKLGDRNINSVNDLKNALASKKGGVMMEGRYPDFPGQYYYAFGL